MNSLVRPKKIIETWMTGRIGSYYLTLCTLQDKMDLEIGISEAEKILSQRPYQELIALREQIEQHGNVCVLEGDYERAAVFRDILIRFDTNVLGLENLIFANH
jgi:hypothetical protein